MVHFGPDSLVQIVPPLSDAAAGGSPEVTGFFDPLTSSVQYVVADLSTSRCAIIDPVLDYEEKSGSFATRNADRILDYIAARGFAIDWLLDTHPHADHCSAVDYLRSRTSAPTGTGKYVSEVQAIWQEIYNSRLDSEFRWDTLFSDRDVFSLGSLQGQVIHSPGHTLASVTFVIGNCAFVHDTIFMPDSGTARADFPGGSAATLWRSINKILDLPDETLLFCGHDYQPGQRQPAWQSTVAAQKAGNIHLIDHPSESAFVAFRDARDAGLPLPRLMLHVLQLNLNGGRLPAPESNGRSYLKMPLGAFESAAWEDGTPPRQEKA